MIDIFGTLGPSCYDFEVLKSMFADGMTGIRVNLSHTMLTDCEEELTTVKNAAKVASVTPKILIDLQGPELRIGDIRESITLNEGDVIICGDSDLYYSAGCSIPLDNKILSAMEASDRVLLDDGKILLEIIDRESEETNSKLEVTDRKASIAKAKVIRGGMLSGRKSILIENKPVQLPTLTEADHINIAEAVKAGITGVMLPFVRSRNDLTTVKAALAKAGADNIKVYAKIENMAGVAELDSLIPYSDEIVIARGDLGNSMLLWELPGVQKEIAAKCREQNKPFMVVTQMLSSMEHSKVPTRAEVSDIFNAVLDGASSVMVTGETAIGENPVDVIRYLSETVKAAERFLRKI